MHSEILEVTWREIKGSIRRTWGKLTDNEMEEAGIQKLRSLVESTQRRFQHHREKKQALKVEKTNPETVPSPKNNEGILDQ